MDDGRRAIALAHWNEVKIDEYCRGLGDVSQCSILFGKCVYQLRVLYVYRTSEGFAPKTSPGLFYTPFSPHPMP